jgi:ABC-2 family transporter protein
MNDLNTIFHLARADFLERTRRYSFLVMLVLIVFMAYAYVPSSHSGYITLSVDGARGIYNSAWVANLVAILVGITMPGLGFFLVKNVITRDTETGVGQILATTPLKRPAYTIGKWLSNLAVLVVMLAVTILATIVLQLALGEDRHIQLASLLPPLIWIILPTLALVAALAIFFETISWLNGGFGNAVYFFACAALTMATFMPVMIGFGKPTLGDVLGIGRPLSAMLQATIDAFPNLDAGNNSIGPVPNFLAGQPLQTFVWAGITWTPADILARLQWIGVGLVIVLLATLFFNRFDPSRSRYRKTKGVSSAPAAQIEERPPMEQSFEMCLTPLSATKNRFHFGRTLWAEMRLIRKSLSKKWLLVAAALFIAGMLVSPKIALQYILPATWLWPLLVWSQLGARETKNHTEALVFSTAYSLQRQLPAMWLAGVLMTGLTGSGAAINFLRNGELTRMLTWTLAVLFIPTLALALSTWSGSSKLFEVVYLAIWYFGPLNHLVLPLDFLSASINIQIFYLFAVLGLSVVTVIGRRKQLNK